ncbi:MAG: methyltransferase domain-containing protein [Nanoarchaeota archaeon]|nr:methyltransferase domain-containing protein [Nanoarchaeota archaeon]
MIRKTQKAYDAWALKYDQDVNPHLILEHEDVLKLVDAKKDEKILDAACGTGRYTEDFFRKKAKIIGIDFSIKMIEVARKKNTKIDYRVADLTKKLPFPNNYFDKINCGQALKHIKNLKFTLREFHRVLKKNGKLIFSVTHPDMDWTDYNTRSDVSLDLRAKSDIFQHKFCDYFEAFEYAGFKINVIKQVKINEKIKHILTANSYRKVKGRYENIIFKLIK